MSRADKAVFSALALGLVVVMALLFAENLPRWCATPHVGGNHIVQPLCK